MYVSILQYLHQMLKFKWVPKHWSVKNIMQLTNCKCVVFGLVILQEICCYLIECIPNLFFPAKNFLKFAQKRLLQFLVDWAEWIFQTSTWMLIHSRSWFLQSTSITNPIDMKRRNNNFIRFCKRWVLYIHSTFMSLGLKYGLCGHTVLIYCQVLLSHR